MFSVTEATKAEITKYIFIYLQKLYYCNIFMEFRDKPAKKIYCNKFSKVI